MLFIVLKYFHRCKNGNKKAASAAFTSCWAMPDDGCYQEKG